MESKLISISNLIKTGWELYLNNFQKFLLPLGLMLAPAILLDLLGYLSFPGQTVALIFMIALSILIDLWASIIFIDLINKIYKKQTIDMNNIFQTSIKKIASYFWVLILSTAVILAGFILLIIPGIIFAVWFSFAEYIVVLEEDKGIKTLANSKDLVKGRWGAAFWRLVLPALIFYAFGMVLALLLTLAASLGHIDFTTLDQNLLFNQLTSFVFLILGPLFTAYSVILYNSLKETKTIIIQ